MSDMTAASRTTGTADRGEVRARTAGEPTFRRQGYDETKPSLMTTEFWLTIAGIVALIVLYNYTDDASLDLFRTALLCTLGGMAYLVSRGLAKAGAYRSRSDDR